jgi:hypothetical protein
VLVFRDVKGADGVAVLGGDLRDEGAGFAFAKDEDVHGKLQRLRD